MPSNPAYSEMLSELRQTLPAELPSFLAQQRWFGGKARQILRVEIADVIPICSKETNALVLVVTVKYVEGPEESYSIPYIAQGSSSFLEDAFSHQEVLLELFEIIKRESDVQGEKGRLRGHRTTFFSDALGGVEVDEPKQLTGEQSNSSVIYGDRGILKFFRRLEEGENPDLEIGRFLTEKKQFQHVPRIAGWIDYEQQHGKTATQGILQEFVPNQGDAWRYVLRTLTAFYEGVADSAPQRTLPYSENIPEFAEKSMSQLLDEMALLGKRTAQLHLALSSESDEPAFAPEPFTMEFQNNLQNSFVELTRGTLRLLSARSNDLPADYKDKSYEIIAREQDVIRRFRGVLTAPIEAKRIRIHGDYHLGQVLYTGSDFVIIDFEGEPARPLVARRLKQSPLQDVAGMLRSFHYAAFAPFLTPPAGKSISGDKIAGLSRWAEMWSRCAANRFLDQYYETSGTANYLPASAQERAKLLEVYVLAKAIYELGYELNNRPAWVGIPLEGIWRLLSSER